MSSQRFLAFVSFQCPVASRSSISCSRRKAQLYVFYDLCACVVRCHSCDVMCFLSEEIYRHVSLPDRHSEPPGFPKEKIPQAGGHSVPVAHPRSPSLLYHNSPSTHPSLFACVYCLGSWFQFSCAQCSALRQFCGN